MKHSFLRCILYSLSFVFALSSCSEYQIKKGIKEMQSQSFEINYDSLLCISNSECEFGIKDNADYRWVVYFDSVNCKPCLVKSLADNWTVFMKDLSKQKIDAKYVFIFSAKACDSLDYRKALENNEFNYPIFLDTLNIISHRNPQMPDNPIFHTFLLNDSSRVMLIGNPANNDKIKKMFYDIVKKPETVKK